MKQTERETDTHKSERERERERRDTLQDISRKQSYGSECLFVACELLDLGGTKKTKTERNLNKLFGVRDNMQKSEGVQSRRKVERRRL
jgi:hypothetical protein